jgi:tyrosyl-tRNA synthetase
VDKEKVSDVKLAFGADRLLNGRFLLLQKGKKDYCLIKVV